MDQRSKGKIAIIGSGLIGRSWALIFAKNGHPVVLYDVDSTQIDTAIASCRLQLQDMQAKGMLHEEAGASSVLANISGSTNLADALSNVSYVQECVPENLDMKKQVFETLDSMVGAEVVLASSTSCLMPSLFTEGLNGRHRCLVAHPINPPYYIPLVEIVPAPWTSSNVIQTTKTLMSAIGQAPVVAKKEVNGFILNRLQYAVIMESWRLVEEGICSPEDVDTAVTEGLGLRYALIGPFQTMHLNASGMTDYCRRYGKSIEGVCHEQREPRSLAGDTLKVVAEAMEKRTPLCALEKARQQRDAGLAELAKLKQRLHPK